jgi:hypothetical protein
MTKNYISIQKWADKNNVDVQSAYRWIREKKIDDSNFIKEKVTKEILRIDENVKIPDGCGMRK